MNLVGSPTDTCNALAARDGTTTDLIETGAAADNSLILRKPAGLVSHVGGTFGCFGVGAACWDTTLSWLMSGAPGPGGGTCGD